MKRYFLTFLTLIVVTFTWVRCAKNFPVDEDGLLITTRGQCYVGNFEILGADFQTVRTAAATIDTTAQTINVMVMFGTMLMELQIFYRYLRYALEDTRYLLQVIWIISSM